MSNLIGGNRSNNKFRDIKDYSQQEVDNSKDQESFGLEPVIIRFCFELKQIPQRKHLHLLENINFSEDDVDENIGENGRVRKISLEKDLIIKGLVVHNVSDGASIKYFDGSKGTWRNFPPNGLLEIFSTQSYKYCEDELPPNENQGFGAPWIIDLLVKIGTPGNVSDTLLRASSSKSQQPLKESLKLERLESLVLGFGQQINTHYSQPENSEKPDVLLKWFGQQVIEHISIIRDESGPYEINFSELNRYNSVQSPSQSPISKSNSIKAPKIEENQKENNELLEIIGNLQEIIGNQSLIIENNMSPVKPIVSTATAVPLSPQTVDFNSPQASTVDLVFLHSDPLLIEEQFRTQGKDSTKLMAFDDKLEIEKEFNDIFEAIKATKKKFIILRQVATYKNLKLAMTFRPRFLHISCHGAQCKNEDKYYLAFENTDKMCLLDRLTEDRLKNLLGNGEEHSVQVVFVSACHSQKLGELFKRVGVPVVIAINQLTPVLDDVCRLFATMFYSHMITGSSPYRAFEEAKNTVKASSIETQHCCCQHDHETWCEWKKKYNVKNQNEKEGHIAHTYNSLEMKDCDCQQKKNKLESNEHLKRCKFNQKFKEQFKSSQGDNRKNRSITDNRELVCCCRPQFPHDEDSKFIIIKRPFAKNPQNEENKHLDYKGECTEEQAKEKDKSDQVILNKPFFVEREEGQCQMWNNKNIIDQLNQIIDPNMISGRNHQISEIVTFINDRDQRMLHLHGPQSYGISDIANYAGKYALNGRVELEGALYVELNSKNSVDSLIQTILKRLSERDTILQNVEKYTKENIIRTIRDRKYLFIINRRTELNDELKVKFNKFLGQIMQRTEKTKFIIITPQKDDILPNIKSLKLEIPLLERTVAVNLIIKLVGRSRSMTEEFNIDSDISDHPILQLLPLNPAELVKISELMNSDEKKTLQVILEEKSKEDQNDFLKAKQQDKGETLQISTTLNNQKQKSNFVMTMIWKELLILYPLNEFSQEYQLLYILCQMANGLFEKDIDLIWYEIKISTSKDWRIFLHSISEFQGKNIDKKESEKDKEEQKNNTTSIDIKEEEQNDNISKKKFKLLTYRLDNELNQYHYFPLPQTVEIVNQQTKDEDRENYFDQCLKQMAIVSYQIITGYSIEQSKYIDIRCVSALYTNIQSFWRADYMDTIEEQLEIIAQQSEADSKKRELIQNQHSIKFFQYLPNFLKLIEINNLPKETTENFQWSIQELCINTVSILLNLNWIDDVLSVLEQCEKIAINFELPELLAKLNILLVSVRLREGQSPEGDLIKKLQIVEDTFQEFKYTGIFNEGLGEALYLEAIIKIDQVIEREQYIEEETKGTEKSNPTQFSSKTLQTEGQNNLTSNKTKIKPALSQKIKQQLIKEIIEKLDKAKQYFKETGHEFGVAKAHLLEAEFLSDINFNSDFDIHSDTKIIISGVRKIFSNLKDCFEIFEKLNLRTLQARTLKNVGLLWYRIMLINTEGTQGQNLNAKNFIRLIEEQLIMINPAGLDRTLDYIQNDNKNSKQSEQQRYFDILLKEGSLKDTAIYFFVSAISLYESINDKAQYDELLILINNTLDLVTINNLIIFTSASPLIEKVDISSKIECGPKIQAIGSLTKIESEIKKILIDEVKQSKHLVNIKFDILNRQLIDYVKKNGCKILHITSTVSEEEGIYMEDLNGLVDFVPIEELKIIIKPDDGVLKIDLVVIAIPKSTKIAQVFIDLGVKNVIAFNFQSFSKNPKSIIRELCYIQAYCVKFYKDLLEQNGNVRESFKQTLDANDQILESALKQFIKVLPNNMKEQLKVSFQDQGPILFPQNDINMMTLTKGIFYEITQQSITKSPDQNVDMSRKRKPINFDISELQSPFTGSRQFIYELIQDIIKPKVKIINMFGIEGIGKTRIAFELSHYLSERDVFKNGTYYVDLQGINTSSQLKEKTEDIMNQGIALNNDDKEELNQNHLLIVLDHFDDLTEIRSELYRNVFQLLNMNQNIKVIMVSKNLLKLSDYHSLQNTPLIKQVPSLNTEEVVDLILNTCMKNISLKEVNNELIAKQNKYASVPQYLLSNDLVQKCKGLPKYILMLSKLMQTQNLSDIKNFEGPISHQLSEQMHNYQQQQFIEANGRNQSTEEEKKEVQLNDLKKQQQSKIEDTIKQVNKKIQDVYVNKSSNSSFQMKVGANLHECKADFEQERYKTIRHPSKIVKLVIATPKSNHYGWEMTAHRDGSKDFCSESSTKIIVHKQGFGNALWDLIHISGDLYWIILNEDMDKMYSKQKGWKLNAKIMDENITDTNVVNVHIDSGDCDNSIWRITYQAESHSFQISLAEDKNDSGIVDWVLSANRNDMSSRNDNSTYLQLLRPGTHKGNELWNIIRAEPF